jgi:hypothetical protein
MYVFSVGFAVFGALVCLSALATERRPLLGADGIFGSRRCGTTRIDQPPALLVATLLNVSISEDSRFDKDVDIHGVEAESDLEKPHYSPLHKKKVPDSGVDR